MWKTMLRGLGVVLITVAAVFGASYGGHWLLGWLAAPPAGVPEPPLMRFALPLERVTCRVRGEVAHETFAKDVVARPDGDYLWRDLNGDWQWNHPDWRCEHVVAVTDRDEQRALLRALDARHED